MRGRTHIKVLKEELVLATDKNSYTTKELKNKVKSN